MSQRAADEVANRRGLVLGLTLAELLLLLLFLLLLALGWRMSALQKEAEDERSKAASLSLKIEGIEATLDFLKPLMDELKIKGGLDGATVQSLVEKLGRADVLERELAELRRSQSELAAENKALKAATGDSRKIEAVKNAIAAASEINPNNPPEALARAIEVLKRLGPDTMPDQVKPLSEMTATADLQARAEALEGERNKYKSQLNNLMRSGNGLTYPSCWRTPEDKTEFMFDVTIRDDGLVVKDATLARANDPQMKMAGAFQRGAVINEGVFDRATTDIFVWSQTEKCRFYSIIRDGTGPTSKKRYKKLRTLVEGHFYVLISSLPATR